MDTLDPLAHGGGPGGYRTAQSAVADTLRYELVTGQLTPGTHLRQSNIATRMQTSTTPVREALRGLVAEGLLTGDAHRGVVVASPSVEQIEELYEIRTNLEQLAIAKAVGTLDDAADEHLDALIGLLRDPEDRAQWLLTDRAVHATLLEQAGNDELITMVNGLRDRTQVLLAESLEHDDTWMERATALRAELVAACRDGDAERAVALVARFLEQEATVVLAPAVADETAMRPVA